MGIRLFFSAPSSSDEDQRRREIYRQTSSKMMAVCRRYFPDKADAEDVMQDGYIRVFEKLDQYKGSGSLEGWIRRVMVSTAIDRLRKEKSFKHLTDSLDESHSTAQNSEEPVYPADSEMLVQALGALPPGYRAVFNLYAIESYTHAEIAQALGISVGTSKSQLSHARNFLKNWLKQQYPEIYHERIHAH